jgi:hypothetical protein
MRHPTDYQRSRSVCLTGVCLNAATLSISLRKSLADLPSIAVIVLRLADRGLVFRATRHASFRPALVRLQPRLPS